MPKKKTNKTSSKSIQKNKCRKSQFDIEELIHNYAKENIAEHKATDKRCSDDRFGLQYPKVMNYLQNLGINKKHIILDGGTQKEYAAIIKRIIPKMIVQAYVDGYDYIFVRNVDCLRSYDEIDQMVFEDTTEDNFEIEQRLKKIIPLLRVIQEMLGDDMLNENQKYSLINYCVPKGSSLIGGMSTKMGDQKFRSIFNDVSKAAGTKLSDETLLEFLLGSFYGKNSSFKKVKVVLLMDLSGENRISLETEGRSDFIVATLKEGESLENLSPVFRNKNLFEVISLDGKDDELKLSEVKSGGKQRVSKIGQVNTRKKLSKSLEYIRLDDDDNMFYTKAKGKDIEQGRPLKLTGQPYKIFHCLFNAYESKSKKASVEIDKVLYEAGIKRHKKRDYISKEKRGQLSVKITTIKDELYSAGFDRCRIKIIDGHCELDIECRYDI